MISISDIESGLAMYKELQKIEERIESELARADEMINAPEYRVQVFSFSDSSAYEWEPIGLTLKPELVLSLLHENANIIRRTLARLGISHPLEQSQ